MNYISGIKRGIGVAQTSAEQMLPVLRDVYLNLKYGHAFGVNAVNVRSCSVMQNDIFIEAEVAQGMRQNLHMNIEGANAESVYSIYINGLPAGSSLRSRMPAKGGKRCSFPEIPVYINGLKETGRNDRLEMRSLK